MKVIFPLVSVLTMSVALTQCGKKSSDSDPSGTTGTAGPGSQLVLSGSFDQTALRLAGGISRVVAVPVTEYGIEYIMKNLVEAEVGSDGAFNVNYTSGTPHVLLAMSDSEDAFDAIQGVVTAPAGEDSLMRMPTDDATANMDLGSISAGDSEFSATTTVDSLASSTSSSSDALAQVAATDNTIESVKNALANIKADGTYMDTEPYLTFSGDLSTSKNEFHAPEEVPYNGFGLYFNTNREMFTELCEMTKILKVTPPSALTMLGDWDYSVTPPVQGTNSISVLSNEDMSGTIEDTSSQKWCGSSDGDHGWYYASKDNGRDGFGFNFGANGFSGVMPSGVWHMTLDDVEIAKFDLASAHPLDADGKPKVFIPSMKVITNGSGIVTGAEIKWYIWNKATSAYVQLTDLTAFDKQVTELYVGTTDYSGCDGNSDRVFDRKELKDPVDGVFTVSGLNDTVSMTYFDANTGNTNTVCAAESIDLTYKLNGISIRFDYRHKWTP